MQYLNALRVEKACALLKKDEERSVTDIALECGFATSQYFATVFRRHCRCTPREYRRAAKAQRSSRARGRSSDLGRRKRTSAALPGLHDAPRSL